MEASPTETIAQALTSAIVEHRLRPGSKLVEQTLADHFAVSRTLVRQALFQLSQKRLVTLEPARGAFVASPSAAEARQVFAVRRMLEVELTRAFVRDATPEHIDALRAHVAAEPGGFDALVVDYRLSGALNGIEAAAQLWQLAGRTLPTILVTGDTDPARVRAAYDSGLTVMFKPVQPEALLQTLHALIRADVARPA